MEFDERLERCILTERAETKTLPCRRCQRPCVVTQFASPMKTECSYCRKGLPAPELVSEQKSEAAAAEAAEAVPQPEFDESLEPETLTDKDKTKAVPCRRCRRRCVVTTFATASKVECNTCRGSVKTEKREVVRREAAETTNPAKLANLSDGLINPAFGIMPLCPFDPEHAVELKSIAHTPNYGPRHYTGIDSRGIPKYEQKTGESVTYQCNECKCTISFSTQHPLLMRQNEEPVESGGIGSVLATVLGVRDEEAA